MDDIESHGKNQVRNYFNCKTIVSQKTSHQVEFKPLGQVQFPNAAKSPEHGFIKNPERKKISSIPSRAPK